MPPASRGERGAGLHITTADQTPDCAAAMRRAGGRWRQRWLLQARRCRRRVLTCTPLPPLPPPGFDVYAFAAAAFLTSLSSTLRTSAAALLSNILEQNCSLVLVVFAWRGRHYSPRLRLHAMQRQRYRHRRRWHPDIEGFAIIAVVSCSAHGAIDVGPVACSCSSSSSPLCPHSLYYTVGSAAAVAIAQCARVVLGNT